MKSENLNLLDPSLPLQVCNRTDVPLGVLTSCTPSCLPEVEFLCYLTSEKNSNTIFRNVGDHSPTDGGSHPRPPKFSITPLWNTNMSKISPLTPNDAYRDRTAPVTSKSCILDIYSTNIGTEYFKHDIYSPFFPPQNAVCFIILKYLVLVLFAFYIQGVLKLKK